MGEKTMKINLHTHTPRCRHAKGSEREYVEKAIEGGMTVLGFSDHTPQYFDGDYYSTMRMYPEELEDYVTVVEDLKKEYADDIRIYLGLEVEYYPRYFGRLLDHIADYPFDYLIQGQHFLGNEDDMNLFYVGHDFDDEEKFRLYVSQTIEGMKTGKFLYLAHPDLPSFKGDHELWRSSMRTLAQAAKELDIPLEINLQGLWMNRHYPNPEFWEIAGEVGNKAVIGADAHFPDKLYIPEVYSNAIALAEKYHVPVVQEKLEQRMTEKNL